MTLYHQAAAMQAVDSMMSYKPMMSSSKQRVCLFLVTKASSSSAPLAVHAVDMELSKRDISRMAMIAAGRSASAYIDLELELDTPFARDSTPLVPLPGDAAADISSKRTGPLSAENVAAAVTAEHVQFGRHLNDALLHVGSSSRVPMVFGTCFAFARFGTCSRIEVPLWFVTWGEQQPLLHRAQRWLLSETGLAAAAGVLIAAIVGYVYQHQTTKFTMPLKPAPRPARPVRPTRYY
jgi:hypothetical protein